MCGQRQSSYTPDSTAAGRRQLHSSCRLDSQCGDDQEEEDVKYLALDACVCRYNSVFPPFFTVFLVSVSVSADLSTTFCSIYKVPQQISVFSSALYTDFCIRGPISLYAPLGCLDMTYQFGWVFKESKHDA